MMKTKKKHSAGFTLVELIIVIAIIAVLSVIAVVAYSNISKQAEEAAVTSDASTVIRALNTFNALAATGHITAPDSVTSANLQALALDEENGGIIMKLGVGITDERLTKVKAYISYDATNEMWILITPATEESE